MVKFKLGLWLGVSKLSYLFTMPHVRSKTKFLKVWIQYQYFRWLVDLLLTPWVVVGEQPYKSRDMVGSDSGLGHLLVTTTAIFLIFGHSDICTQCSIAWCLIRTFVIFQFHPSTLVNLKLKKWDFSSEFNVVISCFLVSFVFLQLQKTFDISSEDIEIR